MPVGHVMTVISLLPCDDTVVAMSLPYLQQPYSHSSHATAMLGPDLQQM